jgi:hypothetical protein
MAVLAAGFTLILVIGSLEPTIDTENWRIVYGFTLYEHRQPPMPFGDEEFIGLVLAGAAVLGAALGLWQTLFESFRGTWAFLKPRPMSLRGLLATKLSCGVFWIVLATGLPVLLLAFHLAFGLTVRPFRWWMTTDVWVMWSLGITAYLAVFLCGLRDARWYVSRFWPAVAVVFLPLFPIVLRGGWWWIVAGLLVDLILLAAIFVAARERDYA